MPSTILALRAIVFQFLFLAVAIVIETIVLHKTLRLDYKISAQYAFTINLLSVFVGWIVFFNVQPLIPEDLRPQIISILLFEQLSPEIWQRTASTFLFIGLGVFLATFFLKFQGLRLLKLLLERTEKNDESEEMVRRFLRQKQSFKFRRNSEIYAVFVGNSCSFSAILFLLLIRLFEQTRYP